MVNDLDFADDISLLSDTVEQACTLLRIVEKECKNTGLGLNAKKIKVMPINTKANEVNVKTMDGTQLDVVDDFKVTAQVCGSNFSKIVILGVHNLCGVAFLLHKKEIQNLCSLQSYCKFPFLHDSLCHSSEVFLSLVSRLDFS